MSDPSEFQIQWDRFQTGVDACVERLLNDLEECWNDCRQVLDAHQPRPDQPPPDKSAGIAAFAETRRRLAREQLQEPLARLKSLNAYPRALLAWQKYEQGLADLALLLPDQITVPGTDMLAALLDAGCAWHQRLRLRWRRRPVIVPLRSAIMGGIAPARPVWFPIIGKFLMALLTAQRYASRAWLVNRAVLDHQEIDRPLSPKRITARTRESERDITATMQAVAGVLMDRSRFHRAVRHRFARGVIRDALKPPPPRDLNWESSGQQWREHWWKQEQAVNDVNNLEIQLERFESRLTGHAEQLQASIHAEFDELQDVIDRLLEWLATPVTTGGDGAPPWPEFRLVPAASRLADFERFFLASLDGLPKQTARHSWRLDSPVPPRSADTISPHQVAQEAFRRQSRERLDVILARVGERHSAVVTVLERAREVIQFAAADGSTAMDLRVRQEASDNAISLLANQRREIDAWKSESDRDLPAALAAQFTAMRQLLAMRRLGLLASASEYGLARCLTIVGEHSRRGLQRLFGVTIAATEKELTHLLRIIGWKTSGELYTSGVTRRPLLPATFTAESDIVDSSALYHRLFRQVPVEDPRFLQGRDHELAALHEARQAWDAGHPTSWLVVGARGSGKTSLINCILRKSFSDVTVLRAEFKERILDAGQLHAYLARLAALDDPDRLEEWLGAGRRVIVLEELERTFLRQVGRYEAIRALMRLISATSRNTLWIVAINWSAFNLLRAAVGLEAVFSHRLRIGVVSAAVLREAIMARHYYSALRIEYPPPAAQRRLVRQTRQVIGRRTDPESVFFDALATASGGLFRAAIDIWLGQIDRIQAGVLTLRPFELPDLTPVIEDLAPAELFTLVAITQHGSLAVEEHAEVFQTDLSTSRALLDELTAREIIEPDPAHPGYRIRPEAMKLVYEAVYRRGLI